jgi:hypothetical protein
VTAIQLRCDESELAIKLPQNVMKGRIVGCELNGLLKLGTRFSQIIGPYVSFAQRRVCAGFLRRDFGPLSQIRNCFGPRFWSSNRFPRSINGQESLINEFDCQTIAFWYAAIASS